MNHLPAPCEHSFTFWETVGTQFNFGNGKPEWRVQRRVCILCHLVELLSVTWDEARALRKAKGDGEEELRRQIQHKREIEKIKREAQTSWDSAMAERGLPTNDIFDTRERNA